MTMTADEATPLTEQSPARWVDAKDVRVGDTLWLGNPRHRVIVERVTQTRSNSDIGLHGNNETWSGFYKPTNRVRIALSPNRCLVACVDRDGLPERPGATRSRPDGSDRRSRTPQGGQGDDGWGGPPGAGKNSPSSKAMESIDID